MGSILSFIDRIQRLIQNSVEYAEHQILLLGIFGFICFPLFYIVWKYIYPQPYENLSLRLIAGALCLAVVVNKYWPVWLKRFLPLIWYIVILYCLPFLFSFMVLMNHWDTVWVMSLLIACFILVLLVDWISMSILLCTGALCAWLLAWYLSPNHVPPKINLQYLTVMLFALVAGYFFNYKTKILRREKYVAMSLISGSIAHELRTPLLGIKSGAVGIKRYLPILFEGYNLAKEHDLDVKPIRKAHYNSLSKALGRIESETDNANTIIDILLMNVGRQAISANTFEQCSMVACIEEALRRYPFSSQEERDKIVWSKPDEDFYFFGTRVLMVHVLFNLIKNALHFIAKARKGNIEIWLNSNQDKNIVYVKDTGKGISAEYLSRVFERFFSTTISGTGIGLSFCRLVIESFGGSISCSSVEGEFTQFALSFPKACDHVPTSLQDEKKGVN